ncbi:MAG: hypothetical protein H0W64_09225 [Gammaproteobacteria bacterium]|nr:hypothetical protein [Gammaproteobacteria bacterium]
MSGEIKRIGTLDIEPSAAHLDTTFFIIQKIGICIMSVLLLGGIFGLFGSGILGPTTAVKGSLQITYNKFTRLQATNVFHINIIPSRDHSTQSSDLRLWIDQSFFKKISIKSLSPTPSSEEIRNNKIIYSFHASDNSQTSQIILAIEPEEFGHSHAEMGLINSNNDKIKIHQFIYP